MPTPTWHTVTTVTAGENPDDQVFTLGIAENADGMGGHLIVQISLRPPTEQDTASAMDTYCVMDDKGGVRYGGIEHVELADTRLTIRFREDAADELSVDDGELQLELDLDEEDVARLRDGLRRTLTYGNAGRQPTMIGF
jgi:Immunity protein 10